MLYKDFEGRTERESLAKALKELNLTEDQVQVEVLSSSKSGFFGIGKNKVELRVFYKEKENNDLDSVLVRITDMITMIDPASTSTVKKLEGDRYLVQVESPDPARLIGKHGRIIEALQDVINGILQRHSNRYKIVVDVVGYNQSQKIRIVSRAKRIALGIAKRGGIYRMEPMNPFYRRLVHLELQKISEIVTQSEGEGKLKSIVISRNDAALADRPARKFNPPEQRNFDRPRFFQKNNTSNS